MKSSSLSRLFTVILEAVALWPLVHFGLTRSLDTNPWKLFGFAMYCTPYDVQLEIWDKSSGLPRVVQSNERTAKLAYDYETGRGAFGSSYAPSKLASAFFEDNRTMTELAIDVGIQKLDPQTHKLTINRTTYHFSRNEDQ